MSVEKSDISTRMKFYEQQTNAVLIPLLPCMVRLDGRSFHSFTKGLSRPYDKRLSDLMVNTTKFLVEESNAIIGYCQSDEISLILTQNSFESEIFFNGRVPKLTSVLASLSSVYFNRYLPSAIPEKASNMPVFDCRVWNVPNEVEAVNCLIWRELDATRNAVSMAAQSYYSHKELMNKSSSEMQELLFAKGINFNDYPVFFKRGTYVKRVERERPFTVDELEKLPPKHAARKNPDLKIVRSDVEVLEDMPILRKIKNRVGVIFGNEKPIMEFVSSTAT